MVLDNSWQKVVTVAPQAMVFIDNQTEVKVCNKCGTAFNFNDNIQNIRIENAINLGSTLKPATAEITLRVPQHSAKVFFRNGRCIFTPMQEISIWMKGYFPRYSNSKEPAGAVTKILGFKNYEFYRVFWGVITQVIPKNMPDNQTIIIKAQDMLYWLDRARGNTPGIYFGRNDGVFQPTFENVAVPDLSRMNPLAAILWILFRFFPGNPLIQKIEKAPEENISFTPWQRADRIDEEEKIGALMLEFWQKRFQDITTDLKIFGLNQSLIDEVVQDVSNRIKQLNQSVERAQQEVAQKSKFTDQSLIDFNPQVKFFIGKEEEKNAERGIHWLDRDLLNSAYDEWLNTNIYTNISTIKGYFDGYKPLSKSTSSLSVIDYFRSITGWEFFQDMNGQLILKPPFYNLNVRSNRVQTIRSWEVLDESITLNEDQLLSFVEITGSNRLNTLNNGQAFSGFVSNPRYLKEFGYREERAFEESVVNNDLLQRIAAIKMDTQNALSLGGTIEIIGRPEILLGYPIYYEPHDAFYYVEGITHNLTFGSKYSTTLHLAAGRRRVTPAIDQLKSPDKLNNVPNLQNLLLGSAKPSKVSPGDENPLSNLRYRFIPNKDEPNPTFQKATVGNINISEVTEDKKLITLRQSPNFKTLFRSAAIMPTGYGYWKLETGRTLRSRFASDYYDKNKTGAEPPNFNQIKDWHFPVSDFLGYEHFGFFSYGIDLDLDKYGTLSKGKLINLEDLSLTQLLKDALKDAVVTTLTGANNIWGVGLDNVDVIEDFRNPSYEDPRYTEGKDSGILQKIKEKVAQLGANIVKPFSEIFCSCLINNSRFKL